jgi:hypothetical protein
MATDFDAIDDALAAVIRSAASPQVQEAQVLLLRRLALEGSVLPSRIPAPLNITEVGGYLNLLSENGSAAMHGSALAAALGLASPAAITWDEAPPPLGWGVVPNPVDTTSLAPLAASMRADLAEAWQTRVVPRLQALGASIALWSRPPRLPATAAEADSADLIELVGRRAWLHPAAALGTPETDTIVLGRADTDPAEVLRVTVRTTSAEVAPVSWNALVWDTVANALIERPIGPAKLTDVGPIVSAAGFNLASDAPRPSQRFDLSWGTMTNLSGLLPGVTRLGEELANVWSSREISRSALSGSLDHVWSGTGFEAP